MIEGEAFLVDGDEPSDYAVMLVQRCEAHRTAIDKHLTSTSENWSLARMPVVDRCILRMALCEMLFVDDVPVSVAINEAVELAKAFGGEDESPRFVNGVLGRIARSLEQGAPAQGDDAAAGGAPAQGDDPAPDGFADAPSGEECAQTLRPRSFGGRRFPRDRRSRGRTLRWLGCEPETFDEASRRIDEIARAVSDSQAPLDELLDLFDEAARLGLAASDLMEQDIRVFPEQDAEPQADDGHPAQDGIA